MANLTLNDVGLSVELVFLSFIGYNWKMVHRIICGIRTEMLELPGCESFRESHEIKKALCCVFKHIAHEVK